jgi:predicted enzyme related to lactoylglutathione lyase
MILQKIKTLILAQRMERCLTFYRDTFGMAITVQDESWSELTFGGTTLGVHGGHDGTRSPTDLSFQVDNIIAACRLVSEAGGSIVAEPDKREGEPIVLATVRDPEGNEIMLTQWVG